MVRLPIVVNPVARGGRAQPPRAALEAAAQARGYRVEWWETEGPGHATDLARRADRDGLKALVAWGGDGTYNEVASGLVDSETHMVVLPGGTTSVLAYELGIPRDPVAALDMQLGGASRPMAVGRTDRGQLFLLMLSAGPDSVILQNLPMSLKYRAGRAGVTIQAVVEFMRARLPVFTVRLDGVTVPVSWCIAGNARCYGGPYLATPGADPFREDLEVVVLTRFGRTSVVPFFFAIPSGRHVHRPGVRRSAVPEVSLLADVEVPYQLDGDPAGLLPVAARASSERVRLLLPAARE